jgi:gluconate kinase
MEQGAGHFMPAALLDSQISLSERPAVYERPIVDDVASAPDAIVNAVTARLGQ